MVLFVRADRFARFFRGQRKRRGSVGTQRADVDPFSGGEPCRRQRQRRFRFEREAVDKERAWIVFGSFELKRCPVD